jgi:hypothetical protein
MPGMRNGQFDFNLSVQNNRIEIYMPRPSKLARRTFARYGPAVVVLRGGLAVPFDLRR